MTDQALTPVLESLFAEDARFDEIRLVGRSLDVLELLKPPWKPAFLVKLRKFKLSFNKKMN